MVYGVDYAPSLLDTPPVGSPTLDSSVGLSVTSNDAIGPLDGHVQEQSQNRKDPIRLLPPSLFASVHLDHLVSHPPDHVLFPFLHGLEGENDAQNTFFANANVVVNNSVATEGTKPGQNPIGGSHHVVNVTVPNIVHEGQRQQDGANKVGLPPSSLPANPTQTTTHQLLRPKAPQYRGLVWVVCEDDLKDDKVTLSILRRKPLPVPSLATKQPHSPSDEMLLDETDDAMLTSSDDEDDLDEDSTTSDSESSSFGDDEEFEDDIVLQELVNPREYRTDSSLDQQGDDRGIMSTIGDDVPTLGKPVDKETLDRMPYMHPIVSPHHHANSSQFSSLPALDTSNFPMSSSSVSSSSSSELGSVFTADTTTPTTGTADTSVSNSPTSASPSCGTSYTHPQVIELHESPTANPTILLDERENKRLEDVGHRPLGTEGMTKSRTKLPKPKQKRKTKPQTDPAAPPLLTCTFRPKELLRKRKVHVPSKSSADASGEEGGGKSDAKKTVWEFVPTRVPEGISLRNFGIQVPIYATLSDIVIYSPKGVTPNALALAQRFREAIQRKREERITTLKGIVYTQVHANIQTYKTSRANEGQTFKVQHHHITAESIDGANAKEDKLPSQYDEEEEDLETRLLDGAERYLLRKVEEELLDYNVFLLDADEATMRKKIGHLMVRSCGSGVPGVEKSGHNDKDSSKRVTETGAHTVGSDGRIAEEDAQEVVKMDTDTRGSNATDVGLVVGTIDIDVDSSVDKDGDVDMLDSVPNPQHRSDSTLSDTEDEEEHLANTVDFALREREEMRDLTKASEIISIFPATPSANTTPTRSTFTKGAMYDSPLSETPAGTPAPTSRPAHLQHLSNLIPTIPSSPRPSYQPLPPSLSAVPPEYTYSHPNPSVDISSPSTFHDPRVGQVFLGNSGDVPLVPEQTSGGVAESARSRLEDVNADGLAVDDPFNHIATNNPAKGFGYDICIECHELAPFPTSAHLRAAEEHLVTLERVWRERVVRKEMEKLRTEFENPEYDGEDSGTRIETKTFQIPPRPPPHANAIIHLPCPSSPPSTQATLAQLIPMMRFLEKWIRPVADVQVDVQVEITAASKHIPETVPKINAQSTQSPTNECSPTSQNVSGVRRWSNSVVSSILPSVFGSSGNVSSAPTPLSGGLPNPPSPPPSSASARTRSNTTPAPTSHVNPFYQHQQGSSFPNGQNRHQQGPAYQQQQRYQPSAPPQRLTPTRPLKILIYSADGYTESSLPSLCLLMNVKGLSLPEAYLDLQVAKRRSFFVYQNDLAVLRRVEARLREERERERERLREADRQRELREIQIAAQRDRERAERERNERDRDTNAMAGNGNGKRSLGSAFFKGLGMVTSSSSSSPSPPSSSPDINVTGERRTKIGRPAAKSVSFPQAPAPIYGPKAAPQPSSSALSSDISAAYTKQLAKLGQVSTASAFQQGRSQPPTSGFVAQGPKLQHSSTISGGTGRVQTSTVGRPRANTSPWLPSFVGSDHQSWFNDPRFDGSFPSRVLPFLYLGNLNHAANVYMLHALGITHVVSVGECALLPPPFHMIGQGNTVGGNPNCSPRAFKQSNPNASGHGSLWIEEREGRIKVLDIKGVCDDGIDTLEPQLEPICEWIDKARAEGGQVLVHCRVGVSRSATVTIAYVMKHLSLPLVDAYLIVRSRRLSVLIQPNMRLLYNLCGWEVKLAKDRAGVSEKSLASSDADPEEVERKKAKMEKRLRKELARTLTWPYLSKEVHALNEKYLH